MSIPVVSERGSHKRSLSQQEIQSLMTGAEISEALETVAHPEELQVSTNRS